MSLSYWQTVVINPPPSDLALRVAITPPRVLYVNHTGAQTSTEGLAAASSPFYKILNHITFSVIASLLEYPYKSIPKWLSFAEFFLHAQDWAVHSHPFIGSTPPLWKVIIIIICSLKKTCGLQRSHSWWITKLRFEWGQADFRICTILHWAASLIPRF